MRSAGFVCKLLGILLKTDFPLIKNVLKSLTKSVLISSRLTAAVSLGVTTSIILKEEMDDIMKIVKSLDESSLLIKGVSKTIKNEAKEPKGGFVSKLLGTLGASLFWNLLTGKGMKAKMTRKRVMRAGKGAIRADHDF